MLVLEEKQKNLPLRSTYEINMMLMQNNSSVERIPHCLSLTDQHQHLTCIFYVLDLAVIAGKIYAWLLVCRNKKNVQPKSKWGQKCKADSVFFLYVNIIDDVLWTCSSYTELLYFARRATHTYTAYF